jgi:hypothetical protein
MNIKKGEIMKKKIKLMSSALLITALVVSMNGCGSDDDTPDTTVAENVTPVVAVDYPTETTQASPYLNKIGENGQVLDSSASSWDMVEIVDEGILVDNPSYVTSLKTYNHDDALVYCENLSSGGYSDFRLATRDELYLILKVGSLSQTEENYFVNYFSDVNSDGVPYSIWSSTGFGEDFYYIYSRDKDIIKSTAYSFYTKKAFCVRTW